MGILSKITIRCIFAWLLVCSTAFLSAEMPVREYQIKAAFLFNFTQFVQWPAEAFSSTNAPLIIGIVGKDPFGFYLDQTVSGEKVNGHPITVQRYQDVNLAIKCHVLFINLSEANQQKQAIASLKGRSILTVGDSPDFILVGGMIRFLTVNNKIQFQINPEAAQAANLTISSKLLSLAQIVIPK